MRYLLVAFFSMSVVVVNGQSKPAADERRYDVDVLQYTDGRPDLVKNIEHSKKVNPFNSIRCDKIVMCDFENKNGKGGMDVAAGKVTNLIIIHKQVQLTKEEITTLHKKLSQRESFGGSVAACYNAHLGFLYYLNDSIVAHISVCMDCGRIYSDVDMQGQRIVRVREQSAAEPYYLEDGMSDKFCNYLDGLLKKNSFSHRWRGGK